MRISDWSSDVCSSDLIGTESSRLTPVPSTVRPRLRSAALEGARNRPTDSVGSRAGSAMRDAAAGTVRAGIDGNRAPDATFCRAQARRPAHRFRPAWQGARLTDRSEEHTSELQSLMRISYAVFCLKKKKKK